MTDEYLDEFKKDTRRLLRERRNAGSTERATRDAKLPKLRTEITNLVEAIATGKLKASAALAARLAESEDELARLEAAAVDGE